MTVVCQHCNRTHLRKVDDDKMERKRSHGVCSECLIEHFGDVLNEGEIKESIKKDVKDGIVWTVDSKKGKPTYSQETQERYAKLLEDVRVEKDGRGEDRK